MGGTDLTPGENGMNLIICSLIAVVIASDIYRGRYYKGSCGGELSYKIHITEYGLTTLETRRLRDKTEVFKISNGYENIDRKISLG